VGEFHDDPGSRVLFATDAGGVGLNLQRAASACINIELPWNPAVLEQRIGRIHRLGQTRPIDVYNLVREPGIESRICDLVDTKPALWFAAARGAGLYDEALALASCAPCDPRTLTRAARDVAGSQPGFAVAAGLLALHWLIEGYGYDITGADVWAAYAMTMRAAATGRRGRRDE
jgi:hypothetical protein